VSNTNTCELLGKILFGKASIESSVAYPIKEKEKEKKKNIYSIIFILANCFSDSDK
jgi:hypothetical protein